MNFLEETPVVVIVEGAKGKRKIVKGGRRSHRCYEAGRQKAAVLRRHPPKKSIQYEFLANLIDTFEFLFIGRSYPCWRYTQLLHILRLPVKGWGFIGLFAHVLQHLRFDARIYEAV